MKSVAIINLKAIKQNAIIALLVLSSLLILQLVIFLSARYGWKLFGFDMCESTKVLCVETVYVTDETVHIVGNTSSSATSYIGYTYEIKDYTQDHILTSQIITEQLNALTIQQKNAITKLVIASSYTSASAESVVWGYNFGILLPYLNNNIWYNRVKYDFTTRELNGVDELLESDITNLINGISSDKINGVTQLKFSGFSNMSVALTYDYEDLPNLEYVWLDNDRYKVFNGVVIGFDFANDTWEQIKQAFDNNYANYKLGDTKSITYNNKTYTIRICDLSERYDLSSGNGKNKATFEFVELVGTGQMNTTNTNSGGWALSYMKQTTMTSIYNNLPSDLKAIISQVSVSSASDGSASGSGSLSYSDNYLFLPSNYELTGARGQGNEIEQSSQFGLYILNNNNSFRIKELESNANGYWTRTPYAGNSVWYCYVNVSGTISINDSFREEAIAIFFCI